MSAIFWTCLAAGATIIWVILTFILKKGDKKDVPAQSLQQRPAARRVGTSRVAAAANRARSRREVAQNVESEDSGSGDDENSPDMEAFDGKNIGVKKRKKLEMKAEKKAAREAELQERERRKQREAELEEERKKDEERMKELERKKEEAEKRRLEEIEKREYEEYLKLKEQFVVDEEGFTANVEEEDEGNLLQRFIDYIKEQKVIVIEDLASHFKLKTQEAIERIQNLQETSQLTGVIDDRGKYLYISEEELKSVAKFIKQRGRVSLSELVDSSNILLNMTPVVS